jgi:hypothetical protein
MKLVALSILCAAVAAPGVLAAMPHEVMPVKVVKSQQFGPVVANGKGIACAPGIARRTARFAAPARARSSGRRC